MDTRGHPHWLSICFPPVLPWLYLPHGSVQLSALPSVPSCLYSNFSLLESWLKRHHLVFIVSVSSGPHSPLRPALLRLTWCWTAEESGLWISSWSRCSSRQHSTDRLRWMMCPLDSPVKPNPGSSGLTICILSRMPTCLNPMSFFYLLGGKIKYFSFISYRPFLLQLLDSS